jgi:hypothetical protein
MIIRIPEEGSKELIKGEFIISRLGSLFHRVVTLQKGNLSHRVIHYKKKFQITKIIYRNNVLPLYIHLASSLLRSH